MSLTKTAILVKQIIFVTAIFTIISIIGFVGYNAAYNYYIIRVPPTEIKPDTKFGKLPPPNFPQTLVSSSGFNYSLDTITGNLPIMGRDAGFENIVKVYFVYRPVATLLSADRAIASAKNFNITTPPQILSETSHRFYQDNKTLTVDLITQNFKYANAAVPSPQPTQMLPNDDQLIAGFKGVLGRAGALKDEVQKGPGKVTILKETEQGKFTPTSFRGDGQFAHISLWMEPIDNRLIHSGKYTVSLISALVAGSANSLDDFLSIEYTYWLVDKTTFATYPAKPINVAFEELKKGEATVVIQPKSTEVSITSVNYGYFMSEEYRTYLMPIYIFEGPEFTAYVSAIDNAFTLEPTQNSNKPSQ